MIPSLDEVYRVNFFIFYNMSCRSTRKRLIRKKTPVQVPPCAMYSLYIQGLFYLCRDKNTQALQQDVVLQVVFVQAWKNPSLLWFSEMQRNCEQRFTLLCYISINCCLLWIREVKEEDSRWKVDTIVHCPNKPSLLSDVLAGFNCWVSFFKIPSGFFPDLLKRQILSI